MFKVFIKVPSLVCTIDARQPYQIFPSDPADYSIIRGCIQTYFAINTVNPMVPLLDRKVRAVVMNTAIVMTLGSNVGIGYTVPVDWFKPAVGDIVLTDSFLRRGEGNNVEGDNVVRPLMGWMGMYHVDKRAGICKFHRDISEF